MLRCQFEATTLCELLVIDVALGTVLTPSQIPYSIQGVAFSKLSANAAFQIPKHVRLLKSKSHTHEAASITAPPDLAILSLLSVDILLGLCGNGIPAQVLPPD